MKAPCGWAGQHRHEGQKIKGVVENKPLPVNNNDTKVVTEKCTNEIQIQNFYIIRGTEILIKEGSEFRLRIMISL